MDLIDLGEVKDNVLYNEDVAVGKGEAGCKTIKVSDIVLNKYGGLTAEMRTIPILSMEIREKELDKQLPKIKSFFASMLSIKTKHQFLLFECEADFVTMDYYEDSKLVTRIGDEDMVLEKHQSAKRSESKVVRQKSGIEWKKEFKKGRFSLGELIDLIIGIKLRPFRKLAYNGGHFSRQVFNYIKDELVKHNQSSIIR